MVWCRVWTDLAHTPSKHTTASPSARKVRTVCARDPAPRGRRRRKRRYGLRAWAAGEACGSCWFGPHDGLVAGPGPFVYSGQVIARNGPFFFPLYPWAGNCWPDEPAFAARSQKLEAGILGRSRFLPCAGSRRGQPLGRQLHVFTPGVLTGRLQSP